MSCNHDCNDDEADDDVSGVILEACQQVIHLGAVSMKELEPMRIPTLSG